ncbi:MAG: sulfotransferase [Myxococcota bacterium]
MNSPITIVSGLPRSGTSLMMQMLSAGGLEPLTDEIRTADDDNPRGYYELEAVKRTDADPSWIEQARGKVVKVIARLLGDLPVGGPYRVIFMRRDLDEVLRSQRKMLERRGETEQLEQDEDEMKQLYVSHLEDVEAWLRQRDDVTVLFVNYNRLVADPRKQAERVAAFLNVDDPETWLAKMSAAVDPSLYRNRKS